MNATIAPDAAGPVVEFISEAVAVLESDLLMISANALEAADDISAFKQRFPFAFQTAAQPETTPHESPAAPQPEAAIPAPAQEVAREMLPADAEGPCGILESFVPT